MTALPAEERTPAPHENAWNPGLESELPREYLPLETVFRSENVSTSVEKARELSDYCGLPAHEIVAFRPERLAVHELLVRVTAGVAVPDGSDYEDLGRNFREIAATILHNHLAPRQAELAQAFERARTAASALIAQELSGLFSPPAAAPEPRPRRLISFGLGRSRPQPAARPEPAEERERRIVAEWSAKAARADNRLDRACFHALSHVANAIIHRHGRLFGDKELIAELALTLVGNDHGGKVIGEAIDPLFAEAVTREGYRPLPSQPRPVVMNIKGASASGKSTMRPFQRILAKKLGLPWEDFALISPDIWRKFLLDYASLGAAYKYAGTLTGHELEIVDKKLDRHMASKAERGEVAHLLIDRFRFDSFVPLTERSRSINLLTRFGDLVYMFFMITPPEMTVERAWTRGLKVGRYKAVEDVLAHNVEAYTGMPELFFTWALDPKRRVHYEFLDNSVPYGRPPRTVAFGWNGEMTILDVRSMLDIDRFRKINIRARQPAEVYSDGVPAPERHADFLKRCARLIPVINFADRATGRFYARAEHGRWVWRDDERFAHAIADAATRAGLQAISPNASTPAPGPLPAWTDLALEKLHTMGDWADAAEAREPA